MPPRYAYWTILIDNKPTAFRAREKEEMLPTFHQLRRTNRDVVLKWFARGRLWETPEAAQAAGRETAARETRARDWRPGGTHKDPRDRFKGEKRNATPAASLRAAPSRPARPGTRAPRRDRPAPPRDRARRSSGPSGAGKVKPV
jgi:hypothetical protein